MLDAVVQSFGFARVRLAENQHSSCRSIGCKGLARDFKRPIFRSVVDYDYAQIWIVRIQSSAHRTLNDFLFVVRWNQYSYFRSVRSNLGGFAENLFAQAVVNCGSSDEEQS